MEVLEGIIVFLICGLACGYLVRTLWPRGNQSKGCGNNQCACRGRSDLRDVGQAGRD